LARTRWGEAFDLVAAAAHAAARTESGMPTLRVDVTVPPPVWCGVPRPAEAGDRFALRLQIDPRAPRDGSGCPLTIDLYRSERVIDTIVVYSPKADAPSLSVDPTGLRPAIVGHQPEDPDGPHHH
jgi:hypothetical protein